MEIGGLRPLLVSGERVTLSDPRRHRWFQICLLLYWFDQGFFRNLVDVQKVKTDTGMYGT